MSDPATGTASAAATGSATTGPDEASAGAALAAAQRATQVAGRVSEVVQGVRERVEFERRPRATYRVQFHREFKFADATALVSYWRSLGISDVYASPYLKAVTGSMHGYDIVDHAKLNPELGTDDDFQAFVAALRENGLGHVLDFVPNHMGVGSDQNAWWQDVLENGPSSKYAWFFDIDWKPLKADIENKVLLPVLGEQFGKVLEGGQLKLEYQDGAFQFRCYDRRYPVSPKSFAKILKHRIEELTTRMSAEDPNFLEYQSILTALGHLPLRTVADPAKREERDREKEVIKRRLQRLGDECPVLLDWIKENVTIFNGQPGDSKSFDLLDELLADQAYRLSFWRVAADEINYRRFFDVNELAAVCMERPEVFEKAHQLVFRLLEAGQLDGLRIDHADGLYDPTSYLWQLQERRFLQLCRAEYERTQSSTPVSARTALEDQIDAVESDDAPVAADTSIVPKLEWPEVEAALKEEFARIRKAEPRSPLLTPLYLVVEKILEHSERLPASWPVHGTSGYDFVNDVNNLFVDLLNASQLDRIYAKFIGNRLEFNQMMYEAKQLTLRVSMSSELHVLGHKLDRISESNRWTRDFTRHGLVQALREVVACFPVYRTYTVTGPVLDRDRRYIEQAIARAKRRNPVINGEVFDFIREVLLLQGVENLSEEDRVRRQAFVGRFQQFTGPVMAKSVEDTSFYRYHRLVSLNEVGCNPERFGLSVSEFHQHNEQRQAQPFAMLATSTHDTKRSEDVRARINVLSEIPEEWKHRLANWSRWNKRKKTKLDGELVPSRNDEYLLYQTLIGTWPWQPPHGDALATYVKRIQQYMTKAAREAKIYSSWISANEPYEKATHAFIESILSDEPMSAFRSDFEPFARQVAEAGAWNSLSQSLLKLTSPGVPDIYQGTELWEFTLVDPDNRQKVDYALRQSQLDEMRSALEQAEDRTVVLSEMLASLSDGRIKLLVHSAALELRKKKPSLFTTGAYIPLTVEGARQEHVCAFVRQADGVAALVVVPRLTAGLVEKLGSPPLGMSVWGNTSVRLPETLAHSKWRNVMTGEEISAVGQGTLAMATLLGTVPVALLELVTP